MADKTIPSEYKSGPPNFMAHIATDDLFAGPLSGFANEMVQTGYGAHPIIGQREGGRGMPTWVINRSKEKGDKGGPGQQGPQGPPGAPSRGGGGEPEGPSAPVPIGLGYIRADLVMKKIDDLVEEEHSLLAYVLGQEKEDRLHERSSGLYDRWHERLSSTPDPTPKTAQRTSNPRKGSKKQMAEYLREMTLKSRPYQQVFGSTFGALAQDPRLDEIGRSYARAYQDSRLKGVPEEASAREAASYVNRQFNLGLRLS